MVDKVIHGMSNTAQADLAARQHAEAAKAQESSGDTGGDEAPTEPEAPGKNFISYGSDGRPEEAEPPASDSTQRDDYQHDDSDSDHSDDDTGAGDSDGSGEGDDDRSQGKKSKKTVQERMNEMTRARREAERARDQERQQREALEARLARLEKSSGVDDDASDDGKPLTDQKGSDSVSDKKPNPNDFKYGEIDPEYIEALSDWKVDQRWKQREEQEKESAAKRAENERKEQLKSKWENHASKGIEKYEDFEEVVIQGAADGAYPLSNELGTMIIESEAGADIAYHLASHPDEAESVYNKTPLEQARWFGATEARFTSDQDAPNTAPVSKAPEPVTRQARGSSGKYETPADTDDFAAFQKRALKELNSG